MKLPLRKQNKNRVHCAVKNCGSKSDENLN